MKLLFILLLFSAAAAVASAARAGGRPKLRNFASAAEAQASVKQLQQTDRKTLFAQWRAENAKAYASPAREAAAFAAFNAAVDDVIAHNSRQGARFFKGLTSTADLTWSEFAATRLMKPVSAAELAPRGAAGSGRVGRPPLPRRKLQQAPPAAFDWRALGKVTSIRDQGTCGSCWAFAAVATLESRALIDGTAFSGDLSEQQMVDCVTASAGFGSNGCSGGRSFEVMDYVHSFRATTEADYAYTGKNGAACLEPNTSAATPGSLTAGGYNYQYAPTRASMQAALVNGGPLVIYFRVVESFNRYSGGIYPASSCSALDINHAMVIVGYDFTGPTPYWIVRNSWGTGWGVDGYALVEATDGIYDWGTCTIYLLIIQPLPTSACSIDHCTAFATNMCTCTACDAGFKLNASSCVVCDGSEVANCTTSNAANKCLCDGCSQGYQPSGDKKSCTLCESVSNCATMNADICQGCDTCAAGYSRSADGKACSQCSVDQCTTFANNTCTCTACGVGYKLSGATCVACDGSEVANCTTPNAANKCLCDACKPDYQLSGDLKSCTLCKDVSNCATMNANSCQGCDTCAAGYLRSADGTTCSQCSVDQCTTFANNTCTCTACGVSYKLSGATCVACDGSEVANCATPNAANKCLCDACKLDYQLSADKKSCSPVPRPEPIPEPAPRWKVRRPFRSVQVPSPWRTVRRACRAQYKSMCT